MSVTWGRDVFGRRDAPKKTEIKRPGRSKIGATMPALRERIHTGWPVGSIVDDPNLDNPAATGGEMTNCPASNEDMSANCSSHDSTTKRSTNPEKPEALGKEDGSVCEGRPPDPPVRRPSKISLSKGNTEQQLKRGPKSAHYHHWTELTSPADNPAEIAATRRLLAEEIMGAAATEPVSIRGLCHGHCIY